MRPTDNTYVLEAHMQSEILRNIQVAKPCPVLWSEMEGDDRSRFCSHCKLKVHNLEGLTTAEAEDLLRSAKGRLCARFYRRPDGTVMTKDCPAGVAVARRRFALAIAFAGAFLMVSLAFAVRPLSKDKGTVGQWSQTVRNWGP